MFDVPPPAHFERDQTSGTRTRSTTILLVHGAGRRQFCSRQPGRGTRIFPLLQPQLILKLFSVSVKTSSHNFWTGPNRPICVNRTNSGPSAIQLFGCFESRRCQNTSNMCGTPLALCVIGGLPSMPAPLIPWRVFFHALSTRKYKQKHLQSWLGRWRFLTPARPSWMASQTTKQHRCHLRRSRN